MPISRRTVVAGLAASIAVPSALATPMPARLAGRIYRQSDVPLSEFRSFLYARWHLDDDPDGMLIRHCETGLTFRVVEAGYPLTVQELRPAAGRPCPVEPLRAYRIGCAARFVASGRYWVKTYRRARHAGAVYYTIYDARHRVMEDAPRLTFAQSW